MGCGRCSGHLILFGGLLLLLRGRRTDVEVTAQAHHIQSNMIVLDIRVRMNPVSSFQTMPYEAVPCSACAAGRFDPAPDVSISKDDPWYAHQRCSLELGAPDYKSLDLRFPSPRKKGGGMSRRRNKWGCRNRRVSCVEIFEVRLEAASGEIRPTQRLLSVIMNALRGQYAEPQEHLQLTHFLPVPTSDPSVIGWRVVFRLSIPKEWWFVHRPSKDYWDWEDDDFLPRPDLLTFSPGQAGIPPDIPSLT